MKLEFLKNEFFILAISGAFQRNSIYKEGVTEKEKVELRKSIKTLLQRLESEYSNKIGEPEHLINLDKLKLAIEDANGKILQNQCISFGTVQKILNLYLKYLWCLDLVAEPPHCPIDRIILNKVKDYITSWTRMDRNTYSGAIEQIKKLIATKSIAEWELNAFKRRY